MTCAPFVSLVEWKIWKGRTLCLNYSRKVLLSRFPSLWLWNLTLDRSTWLLFNFVFFLHWIGAAQRPSFINQFIVVVQWKAVRCRIHLRLVMVRYGLVKVLRGVKSLQTCKKPANGFEKLLLHGLASHSENFSGKLCCCCYIISSTYGRIKLKLKLL